MRQLTSRDQQQMLTILVYKTIDKHKSFTMKNLDHWLAEIID